MQYEIYHGTSKEYSRSILNKGFNISSWGYLGSGVYFYENNKNMAEKWCKYNKDFSYIAILKYLLDVDEGVVLDLTDPNSETFSDFEKGVIKIVRTLQANRIRIKTNDCGSNFIDSYCRESKKYVVRAMTFTNTQYVDGILIDFKFANGIEICIKNVDLIKKELIEVI